MTTIIHQPPHGFVELLDHYGSDARIVAAARISYDGENKGEEQDKKLLFYLYKNRHTSPFEQCNVTFRIKFPIFLMRQFVRHRTFRLNEWSGRYSELADEFFLPKVWRAQDTKNKQAGVGEVESQEACTLLCKRAYEIAYDSYQQMRELGVANEMARFVLPVGIYTKIVVNIDLHNLMHFFRLRLDSHAQSEIRDVAQAMYDLVAPHYPWTFEAFKTL
jgi:thymidylate synthase (FAD)